MLKKLRLRIYRKTGIHQYLPLYRNSNDSKKWVFIVGCYNSGTTLLHNLLARHPGISALPYEGVTMTKALSRPEDYGFPRMWSQCVEKVRLGREDVPLLAAKVKKHWERCFSRQAPINLEKSIVNTARIPWLQEHFSPAYFIFIVRNGYAVSEGIRRQTKQQLSKGRPYSIEQCAFQWKISNEIARQDLAEVNRFIEVSYEELCINPDNVLSSIYSMIGVEKHSALTGETIKVHGVTSSIQNKNKQSITRLSSDDIAHINAVASDELRRNCYEIISVGNA